MTDTPKNRAVVSIDEQIDAVMALVEHRLAIIWARTGSREFFAAELRQALEAGGNAEGSQND